MNLKKHAFAATVCFVGAMVFWAGSASAELGFCGTAVTPLQVDEMQSVLDEFGALEAGLVKLKAQGDVFPQGNLLETYRTSLGTFSERMRSVREEIAVCGPELPQKYAALEEYGTKVAKVLERKVEETRDEEQDPIVTLLDPLWHWTPSVNDPLADAQHYARTLGFAGTFSDIGKEPIIVAVIDDGVFGDHEDLKDVMWVNQGEIPGNLTDDDGNGYIDDVRGWNFVSNSTDLTPRGEHGTEVAGLIGATPNNGAGILGMGGNVKIMPLIVCAGGSGCPFVYVERAIAYAIVSGARVINLSLGKENRSLFTPELDQAIRNAAVHEVVVVAAAGNGDPGGRGLDTAAYRFSPACNGFNKEDVIGVAATDSMGVLLPWSNFGECADVQAPGLNLALTSVPEFTDESYSFESGTSFAAPLISAMVARMLQIDPKLNPREVHALLTGHTRLGSPYFADIANAMRGIAPVVPTEAPPAPATDAQRASYVRDDQRNAAVTINADKAVVATADSAPCTSNTLIKGTRSEAVYYCGADGKRYVFPNSQTYFTWYEDFNAVTTLTDEQLAKIMIGGMVTYRPGTRMLKVQSSPTVYAVAANGELRAIGSEAAAERLYGPSWNTMIDDISDAFFVNYRTGVEILE